MQQFYINKDSVLPTLRMELIFDGRHDFNKFYDAVQNSEITFTMTNVDNGIVKVANQPCYIKLRENDGCIEQYVICYDWKKRDTRDAGVYEGVFTINFSKDLKGESTTYPVGELVMPIREKVFIIIR